MKIKDSQRRMKGRRERGFVAVLVVVALAAVMAVFVVAGNVMLHELEREIDLVEERQEKRWREWAEENRPAPLVEEESTE